MYISEVLNEIRQEIKGTDRNDKVVSLQKLLYLNLLGYTFDWAVRAFWRWLLLTRSSMLLK